MTRSNIAVIGAGLIGQAWALVFARAGRRVRLWDDASESLPQAVLTIAALARTLEQYRLVDDASALAGRIEVASSLEEAVDGVAYVQENVAEDVPIKKDIFSKLDAIVDRAVVIGSSTSGIQTSVFSEGLPGRARCLVAHPANPPYLIPVVEISGAPWTSADAISRVERLMREVGQKPVIVQREIEGFILNRLQGAVLREAFRLIDGGYVDVDGLDSVFRDGLGLRWSFMGPIETIDLNAPGGLADYCQRYGELYRRISEAQVSTESWSQELVDRLHQERRIQVHHGELLAKRLWRDQRLMALAVHKKEQEEQEAAAGEASG